MLNKVMLIGHTGDVIKMHHFEGGGCIGRLPLATNSSYVNKTSGERVEKTEWHNLVIRNKGAEIVEKYVKKGAKLYVEGRLETRKWQDDKGQDRYSTEIAVTDFKFLDSKGESGGTQAAAPSKPGRENSKADEYARMQNSPFPPAGNEDEDDLPF